MFGALHCNKDTQDNLEYIRLSADNNIDARYYTVLACDRCRTRKLKCSGEFDGCLRCQAASANCTYRSSARSTDPPTSRRRQSTSSSKSTSKRSAKRRETESNADRRPSEPQILDTRMETSQSLSPVDFRNGFWTPIALSEPGFANHLHDWDDEHSEEPQTLDLDLDENITAISPIFSLPELQDISEYPESAAVSNIVGDILNGLDIAPLATANPTSTSVDSSGYRGRPCECIQSLADILERISGDGGSDSDRPNRFDILLVHIRNGIETCNQVIPCNYCSVSTTNSMFVVTIVQQLATILQSLCQQLLPYQQKVKGRSTAESPLPSLNTSIHVGKYEVRSAALYTEFTFSIVRLHFKEFHRLLEHLEKDIKKGTTAFKLLSDAADVARKASCDLQIT